MIVGAPDLDASIVPSTTGLPWASVMEPPPIRAAIHSAASRSSAGCAPSLETDSIRRSSPSSARAASVVVRLGVLATGDVDQREEAEDQRDREGDHEDRVERPVMPGGLAGVGALGGEGRDRQGERESYGVEACDQTAHVTNLRREDRPEPTIHDGGGGRHQATARRAPGRGG